MSAAFTATVTVPVRVTPAAGEAIDTVGGVVSAGGGGPALAALNAAICMTHAPALPSVAVATYEPVTVTKRSSAMSPFGFVMNRDAKPVPAAIVQEATSFPATRRSRAFVVVNVGVLLLLLEPVPPTATSSGEVVSMPLYSRMRASAFCAAAVNVTVTMLPPAEAETMFFA